MKLIADNLYALKPLQGKSVLEEAYKEGLLSFKVSMAIKRLLDDVSKEMGIIDQERINLLKQYGKEVKSENRYELPKKGDKLKEFNEKFLELMKTEVNVTYKPIDLDELADITDRYNKSRDEGEKLKVVSAEFIETIDLLNRLYEQGQEEKKEKKKEVEQ